MKCLNIFTIYIKATLSQRCLAHFPRDLNLTWLETRDTLGLRREIHLARDVEHTRLETRNTLGQRGTYLARDAGNVKNHSLVETAIVGLEVSILKICT